MNQGLVNQIEASTLRSDRGGQLHIRDVIHRRNAQVSQRRTRHDHRNALTPRDLHAGQNRNSRQPRHLKEGASLSHLRRSQQGSANVHICQDQGPSLGKQHGKTASRIDPHIQQDVGPRNSPSPATGCGLDFSPQGIRRHQGRPGASEVQLACASHWGGQIEPALDKSLAVELECLEFIPAAQVTHPADHIPRTGPISLVRNVNDATSGNAINIYAGRARKVGAYRNHRIIHGSTGPKDYRSE